MPEDFRVGEDITVYGRQIRLTGSDDYTKEYFVVSKITILLFSVNHWRILTAQIQKRFSI